MVVRNYSNPTTSVPTPGLWRRFVRRPQQMWLRKAIFQIHLWTGILVGLYIIAIGISGSILVFKEELFPRPRIDVGTVDTRACTPESLAAVVHNVELAYPDKEVYLTACPSVFNPLYLTTVRAKPKSPATKAGAATGVAASDTEWRVIREPLAVYSHPHTAAVLGAADREGSWVSWMEDLHVNLLMGRGALVERGRRRYFARVDPDRTRAVVAGNPLLEARLPCELPSQLEAHQL